MDTMARRTSVGLCNLGFAPPGAGADNTTVSTLCSVCVKGRRRRARAWSWVQDPNHSLGRRTSRRRGPLARPPHPSAPRADSRVSRSLTWLGDSRRGRAASVRSNAASVCRQKLWQSEFQGPPNLQRDCRANGCLPRPPIPTSTGGSREGVFQTADCTASPVANDKAYLRCQSALTSDRARLRSGAIATPSAVRRKRHASALWLFAARVA